jgi:hypothetical protein
MLTIFNVSNFLLQSNENGKIALLVMEQSEDTFDSSLFILEFTYIKLPSSKFCANIFFFVIVIVLSVVERAS